VDAKATLKIQWKPVSKLHVRLHRSHISLATRDINTCDNMTNWWASCQVINIISKVHLDALKHALVAQEWNSICLTRKKLQHLIIMDFSITNEENLGQRLSPPKCRTVVVHLYGHIFATKSVDSHLHQTFYFSSTVTKIVSRFLLNGPVYNYIEDSYSWR
jgi:hypothetical protein